MPNSTITNSISSYLIGSDDFTLTNQGTIGTAAVAVGVTGNNDTVINAATIRGATYGVSASISVDLTNSGTGSLIYGGAYGIYSGASASSIVNFGSIGGGTGGVKLEAPGSVANEAGGTITGTNIAVAMFGGTVFNGGGISATSDGIYGGDTPVTVTNSGSVTGGSLGIRLRAGGSVTNASGGTISGSIAVYVAGGNVLNSSRIIGLNDGVEIKGAGSSLTNQHGATISGGGDSVYDNQGTVVNDGRLGTVVSGGGAGVGMGGGGVLTNNADGTIEGSYAINVNQNATIVNFGTLMGGARDGVDLSGGGTLTNESGGTISGGYGVTASGSAWIDNAAGITGTATGVGLAQGYLTNESGGVISGGTNGYGARLSQNATLQNAGSISGIVGLYVAGGSVTNQSGGTISGTTGVKAGQAATLVNQGHITGSGKGVFLYGTATLINQPNATIAGGSLAGVGIYGVPAFYYDVFTGQFFPEGYQLGRGLVTNAGLISGAYGVHVQNVAATVVNKGTIEGTTAAIDFAAGYGNLLVMYPGAVLEGSARGGGVLELASSASKGTLNGGGTAFSGFNPIILDAGAYWDFASGDTFGSYAQITLAGTFAGNALLSPTSNHSVVIKPGASILGTIDGGNTIGNTFVSDVELAGGATPGTLSGFGSNLVNFANITVDADASWTLNPGTLANGVTLSNSGTLGNTPITFQPGAGNRVVLGYGGTFLGTVDGGNTIGGASASILELASGGSPSTLSGLGSKYLDFGDIVVDQNAAWYFTADSFAAGTTLTNGGTVSGQVTFASGAGNRVVIDPGDTFAGTVDGGNTLGSSFTSTLELASGSSNGTLTGLGTQLVNFAQVTEDAGAYWYFSGANTVASNATLTISGEVNNGGTLSGNATLAGGTILNDLTSSLITGNITGTGAAAGVLNKGTVSGSIQLAPGVANGVTIYQGAVFGGVVNGNAPGLATLYLGSGTTTGTLTGFGTQYAGFGRIFVNSGATWSLGNTTTFAAGITLLDAGTVTSPVHIAAGAGNRVVVESTGTFTGTVDGGNTLGGANASTLELAKNGFTDGTINGIGTQFVDFAHITVDSGASWALSTFNTIASNATLMVYGYLGIAGRLAGNVTISGGQLGVYTGASLTGSAVGVTSGAELFNAGTVKGTGSAAVTFAQGGTVRNPSTSALISGATYGVVVSGNYGVVDNGGFIAGSKVGVVLGAGGTVSDYGFIAGSKTSGGAGIWLQSGGGYAAIVSGVTVSGFDGILAQGPSTVVNQGTIVGGSGGDAVKFGAGATQRLVIDPNAVFTGTVDGGNTAGSGAVSTLELASSSGTGTLSGLGSKYINFGSIVVDAGAHWSLGGTNTIDTGSTLSLTNTSLTDSGTLVNNGGIVLDPSKLTVGALTGTGTTTIQTGSELEVQGTVSSGETIAFSGISSELLIDSPASFSGTINGLQLYDAIDLQGVDPASVSYSDGELSFATGSIALSVAPGYTLQIPPVADGSGGSFVYALSSLCFGAGTHIATPKGELPVEQLRIGDLVLTTDGMMQPVTWIGTGRVMVPPGRRSAATPVIVRKDALARDVPHRDLHLTKGHSLCIDDVLIPVEFLVNHRSIVWNDAAREITIYHIELARHAVLLAEGAPAESYRDDGNRWLFENANSGWDQSPKLPCLPILTGGPVVDAIWWRLFHRAGPWTAPRTTGDADLHLMVDGVRINDEGRTDGLHVFRLHGPPRSVRIVSRAGAPDRLGIARDPRQLGIALRQILLWQGRRVAVMQADEPALMHGFHEYEPAEGLRWTDGDATLPSSLFDGFDGPLLLELHVAMTTRYPADGATQSVA